tara:strand:+ start:471 stop:608 length:138 start_codon:yes stop_codon:yes gene_type:complete
MVNQTTEKLSKISGDTIDLSNSTMETIMASIFKEDAFISKFNTVI